jgi:transcription elongation factor GreB
VSRAFKRESEENDSEEILPAHPSLPPGTRNYITTEGAARLRHRLNELLESRRASLEQGYEADRRRLDTAIRRLQATLNTVVVAEPPADQSKVAFGAFVSIRYANADEDEYQIVGVDEADPDRGRISWISPLARVLLSRRAGDQVSFRSPAGVEELTILQVSY